MEAFMDWWLFYRTVDDMDCLAQALPKEEVDSRCNYSDPDSNLVFLEVTRVR
jgi:hypothetical protein